jgi:hypothetical protein
MVFEHMTREWPPGHEFHKHLCPETLLRPSKFDKYLQAAKSAPKRHFTDGMTIDEFFAHPDVYIKDEDEVSNG